MPSRSAGAIGLGVWMEGSWEALGWGGEARRGNLCGGLFAELQAKVALL